MSLLALIVDDEAPARAELRYLLERADGIEVVGEAASVREALALASRLEYDVVFCDISMPELTGDRRGARARLLAGQPARRVRDRAPGLRGAGLLGRRLRLPPEAGLGGAPRPHDRPPAVGATRPARAQPRACASSRCRSCATARRCCSTRTTCYWAEANGDASRVATYDELLQSGQSMRELEDILPSARFFRIHRRHLVNLKQVVRLELADVGTLGRAAQRPGWHRARGRAPPDACAQAAPRAALRGLQPPSSSPASVTANVAASTSPGGASSETTATETSTPRTRRCR